MAKKKIGKNNMDLIKGGYQLNMQPFSESKKVSKNEFTELTKIGKDLMDNFFGNI